MLSYLQYCRVESHPVTIPTPTHVTVLCRVRFLPVASSRGGMTLSMDGGGDKGNGRICGVGIGIVVAGQGLYCCANGCSGYVLKDGGGQDYNFRNRIGSPSTSTTTVRPCPLLFVVVHYRKRITVYLLFTFFFSFHNSIIGYVCVPCPHFVLLCGSVTAHSWT